MSSDGSEMPSPPRQSSLQLPSLRPFESDMLPPPAQKLPVQSGVPASNISDAKLPSRSYTLEKRRAKLLSKLAATDNGDSEDSSGGEPFDEIDSPEQLKFFTDHWKLL